MQNDRRSVLKLAAAAAGASLLPANLRAVLADPAPSRSGTIRDVEHVVIFMQENRSFDHYFGTLRGVRGFADPRAVTLPGGKPVWFQPKDGRDFTPFHLDTGTTSAQCIKSLDHSWKRSHDRWKHHDAWIPTKSELTMGYFTRHDIPFYHALADAFTICDAYHCSVFGPTNPNRLHLFSGTSGLTVGNDDVTVVTNPKDEENETADMANDSPAFRPFTWPSYAERLQQAGIDWRVYQEYDNYGDNALAYFHSFRAGVPTSELHARARTAVAGSNAANAKASRGEHLVAAFAADVAQDRLPQVSWIVAPYIMCEHPTACPSYGESLTARLLDALAANPRIWAKTAFILNYDENDGFFDHVPPPLPAISPDMGASTVDVAGEVYKGVPFGLGPRVPMLVVSPWTAGGFVNSQLFDHTSVLRFLEARFGVAAANISPWRRAVTGDLTSVFDFAQSGGPTRFGDATDGTGRADAQCRLPPAQWRHEALPRQEPGQRPARALPYDFDVAGQPVANGFALEIVNRGAAGATFRAAATSGEGPWYFTVESGKSLSYLLPCGASYAFSVQGPNGFLRGFAGVRDDKLKVAFRTDSAAGKLRGTLDNKGWEPVSAQFRNGYDITSSGTLTVQPGKSIFVEADLTKNANWYDVTIEGPDGFVRQFAGHIENGRSSLSDPLLG
jgi:phospholipase C